MSKKEILFTGLGGQGIVKSGVILAQAAVLEGKHVVQTQNYGPESRGGCCRADVIISDSDICYPKVEKADVILALSQGGLDKFSALAKEDTIIITDKTIESKDEKNILKFDIFKCIDNVLKNPQGINILCLGILAAVTRDIEYKNLEKAICDNVPKKTIEKNLLAFNTGINMVAKAN